MSASVSVSDIVTLSAVVVGAFFLLKIIQLSVETLENKGQQRSATGIALVGGFLISVGLSPATAFASEIARLFQIIPSQYPVWISWFISLETVLALLFGVVRMWESGGSLALLSFSIALSAGLIFPIIPWIGIPLGIVGWFVMELSPADRW